MAEDDTHFLGRASVPVPVPVTAVPYAAPPQPPARRRGCLLAAGLVAGAVILCSLGAIIGFVVRPDFGAAPAATTPAPPPPPSPKVDSPSQVTEKFLAAAVSGDDATVQSHLCELLRGNGQGGGSNMNWLGTIVSYKVGEERIDGPGATVPVELTVPVVGSFNFETYLVKEGNAWKVCGAGPA